MSKPLDEFRDAIRASILRRKGQGDPKRTVSDFNVGDLYDAVCRIRSVESARKFYAGYVAPPRGARRHGPEAGRTRRQVEHRLVLRRGWPEDRIRMWTEACGAAHPVFGQMIPSSPKEALDAGTRCGERAKAVER